MKNNVFKWIKISVAIAFLLFCLAVIIYMSIYAIGIRSNGYKITTWVPDDGAWYCDKLGIQLAFDKNSECYIVADGEYIRCSTSNDRGSVYVIVRCQEENNSGYVRGTTIFVGTYESLTEDEFVLIDQDTGEYCTFVRVEENEGTTETNQGTAETEENVPPKRPKR